MGTFSDNLTPSEKVIIYNDRVDKLKKIKNSFEFDDILVSEIPNEVINKKNETIQIVIRSFGECWNDKIEEFISEQRILLNKLFKG